MSSQYNDELERYEEANHSALMKDFMRQHQSIAYELFETYVEEHMSSDYERFVKDDFDDVTHPHFLDYPKKED